MARNSSKKGEFSDIPTPPPITGRIPPQNLDAEVSVLGALLLDQDAMLKVVDILSAEDFYRHDYGTIYEAMLVLTEKRVPIDIITVSDELSRVKKLDQVGGPAALSTLVSAVATASNVQHYAQIVREKALLRRLINAAGTIGELGYQEEKPSSVILDQAEQTLFGVTQRFLKQNFVPVRSILTESFERLDALSKQEGGMRGLSTGYKHVDSILGGLQPSDLIILAARPSMGKCLTGDSHLLDPETGAMRSIEDMVKSERGRVVTLGEGWQLKAAQPSHFIDNGVKPVAQVKTALGREVETTWVHPFLTTKGWKRLEELQPGDRIAVPKKLPFFGSNSWPLHKVKALAYFIADGSLTRNNPTFTNVDPTIINDFQAAVAGFKGIAVRKDDSGGKRASSFVVSVDPGWYQMVRASWCRRFATYVEANQKAVREALLSLRLSPSLSSQWASGVCQPSIGTFGRLSGVLPGLPVPGRFDRINPVTEFLKEQGVWGKTAVAKAIPADVFTLEKNQVAIFLNRLFSCDGTAYVSTTAEGYRQPVIAYSSISKTLIHQVQHLLVRFGITAKVRERSIAYKDARNTAYELEIHGQEDLLMFAQEIGIFGKEEAVAEVVKAAQSKLPTWTKDTLPVEVWERAAALKGGESWASVYRGLGMPAGANMHLGKRALRRETALKLAQYFGDSELADMAASDIYWDRIVSIKSTGNKQVYDLTVPVSHNFVANDFVVHNTAFALNMAQFAAVNLKKTVGIFSLEMSKEQLVDRLISSIGLIDSWKLRNGRLTDDDFRSLNEAYGVLAEANLFIDDAASANVMEVRAKARRLQSEYGLDLIVIDYLQLMEGPNKGGGSDNRVQEVSEISRSLKALAREIGCPVIALSQLSRAVESRPDKRPLLSDLRESGSIEQDADVVIFLYRDDYYNKEEQNNLMEVMVRKHRNGPTGDAKLLARLNFGRFENLASQNFTPEG